MVLRKEKQVSERESAIFIDFKEAENQYIRENLTSTYKVFQEQHSHLLEGE